MTLVPTPFRTEIYPGVSVAASAEAPAWASGAVSAKRWDSTESFSYHAGTPIVSIDPTIGCTFKPTGGGNAQSLPVSFKINKTKLLVMVTAWASTDISIWVDRYPVSADPVITPGGSYAFVEVSGLSAGTHQIDMVVGWGANFLQVVVPDADGTIVAGDSPSFRLGLVGDSYTDSGLAPYYGGLSRELFRLTGWTIVPLGQGSTGYTNDGSSSGDATKSVYGSASRLAALAVGNVNAVLIVGSVNDSGGLLDSLASAVGSYFSSISTIPAYVLGVEPLSLPNDPGTAWDQTNAAILNQARKASNVVRVIDWRGEDWLTGTGSVSNPRGDGNQDIYIGLPDGSDTIHPNYQGQKYLAQRIVTALQQAEPVAYAGLSNLDLEMAWLKKVTGSSGSVQDLRYTLYRGNEHDYWASRSGPLLGSLADHKLAAMRSDSGASGGSLADVSRVYWAKNR